jgi:ADP-heptose:LPS heptosyltransferase
MKILILRLHQTDKIFATIPLVKAIMQKYPTAIIHYVTSESFIHYLEKFSEIQKIFCVKGDITPLVLTLLKEKYSHTIDLQGNPRTRFITSHLGQQFNAILTKYSYPTGLWRKLFSKKYFQAPNLSSLFISCTKELQLSTSHLQWYFPTTEIDDLKKNDLPMSHSLGYYCIDVVAKHQKEIANVIANINFPVILLGTIKEMEIAEQLKSADAIKIYNACGKYTDGEQCNILKGSKINIVHHTLFTTLSATVSVPIIDTNIAQSHIQELVPFCNNSGISYQTALWIDDNDIISRAKGILIPNK